MINEEIKKWMIKAMNDYKTAERLLNLPSEEIITDTLCFHCQQFVEKGLKAFLVLKNVEFEKVHDIEYLVGLCSAIDKSFEWIYEGAKRLTDYAVEIRYSDDYYIPSIDEAKEAFEVATKFKEFIFKKLEITEEDLK